MDPEAKKRSGNRKDERSASDEKEGTSNIEGNDGVQARNSELPEIVEVSFYNVSCFGKLESLNLVLRY